MKGVVKVDLTKSLDSCRARRGKFRLTAAQLIAWRPNETAFERLQAGEP